MRLPEHTRGIPTALLELLVLAAWTLLFGAEYFNFDPGIVPAGREFGSIVQFHHLWENLKLCGSCAFWNGSSSGGMPAFADIYSSTLHPIVAISTLLFGVINGSKLILLFAFWMAGLAQWWLANVLELGRLPRMWSAMLAVTAGHLAGRMELGVINIVVATAACSLVIPAILAVYRNGTGKNIALLGLTTAGAILGGSGYLQVGLAGLLPAVLVLSIDDQNHLRPAWRDFARAGLLGLLLSAVLMVPFLHFYPNFIKDADPSFALAQPLVFVPLNLVIDDVGFYLTDALGKLSYPYLYTSFIGWTAVILGCIGIAHAREKDGRAIWFLVLGSLLTFLMGSATGFERLATIIPAIDSVRHPSLINGLAVPLILGLSAFGLDRILNYDWPRLKLEPSRALGGLALSAKYLLLIPLSFSLLDAVEFSRTWIMTERRDQPVFDLINGLRTAELAWVAPPFGEHFFVEPAVAAGLKLSPGIHPWRWDGRELPVPALEASRPGPPPGPVTQVNLLDGIPIYQRTDQPYAAVYANGEVAAVCTANGRGGWIDVRCENEAPGVLVVKENMWSGWNAWRDEDGRVALRDWQWLEVDAPAGEHVYYFRYRPWDVPLGIGLSIVGLILCINIWRKE